jgi:hypothetical protein
MGGDRAQMVFTDPPYNVRIEGNVGGLGSIKHRDFAMASGEMTQLEFTTFLTASFQNLVRFSLDGSIHFVCMDWRHIDETLGEPAFRSGLAPAALAARSWSSAPDRTSAFDPAKLDENVFDIEIEWVCKASTSNDLERLTCSIAIEPPSVFTRPRPIADSRFWRFE